MKTYFLFFPKEMTTTHYNVLPESVRYLHGIDGQIYQITTLNEGDPIQLKDGVVKTDPDLELDSLKLTNEINKISIDGTFSDNLDSNLVSEKAIKTFVTASITAKDEFVELNDTPANYTGSAGKLVRVNLTPDSLEFTDSPTLSSLTITNNINEFSTDGTLAGNSDSVLPSEKAVKTYVDNSIASKDQFTELSDTPSSYATSNYKILRVDNGPLNVEFAGTTLQEPGANNFQLDYGTTKLDVLSSCSIDQDLKEAADVIFSSVTVSNTTGSRLVSTDGSKKLISTNAHSWLSPVANQTTISDAGSGLAQIGTVQDINTTSSPTFTAVNTDSVLEKTLNNGVGVDDFTLKDGLISTSSALLLESASSTIGLGTQSVNQDVSIGVGGNRNIILGSYTNTSQVKLKRMYDNSTYKYSAGFSTTDHHFYIGTIGGNSFDSMCIDVKSSRVTTPYKINEIECHLTGTATTLNMFHYFKDSLSQWSSRNRIMIYNDGVSNDCYVYIYTETNTCSIDIWQNGCVITDLENNDAGGNTFPDGIIDGTGWSQANYTSYLIYNTNDSTNYPPSINLACGSIRCNDTFQIADPEYQTTSVYGFEQKRNTSGVDSIMLLQCAADDNQAQRLLFAKSRGTLASPSANQSGDGIMSIEGISHNGTSYVTLANMIKFECSENHSVGNTGTRTIISCIPNSTSVATNTVRVDNCKVGIGVSAEPSKKLHVLDTNEQLRLSYDGTKYLDVYSDLNGYAHINTSNDRTYLDDDVYLKTTSGTASPLNYYEETTQATFAFTNVIPNFNLTIYITRIGNLVHIRCPNYTDNSTVGSGIITSTSQLLTRFRPPASTQGCIIVNDDTTIKSGYVQIDSAGYLYIAPIGSSFSGGGSTTGFLRWEFTYRL